MSDDPAYLRQPGVNATEIDTETFRVGPEDGEVYYLDEVSSALWRFLEAPRRISDSVNGNCGRRTVAHMLVCGGVPCSGNAFRYAHAMNWSNP